MLARLAFWAVAISIAPAPPLLAHDIPARVVVRLFVKPQGRTLTILVRAPLEAMRDYSFPERGPGYLDLAAAGPLLRGAAYQWIASYLRVYQNGAELPVPEIRAVRVSLPSDRSFESFDLALAHLLGPALPESTELPWTQAQLDVFLEVPIESDRADFSIEPALAHLGVRTTTVLRFLPPTGAERAFQYLGNPGLVRLDPSWWYAVWRFVVLGFEHILSGLDHLLFLLCLVVPVRRLRPLVVIVTAFTVAHSITLVAATLGLGPKGLWFPPLIETLIAFSILWMTIGNVIGGRHDRRWLVAFGFGLVHGFGFSFALERSLQFAGAHLISSLFAFNLGVELGQLAVIALLVPLLGLLFRRVVTERIGTILISLLVGHTAWHWMTERGAGLLEYQWSWPELSRDTMVTALRGLMLLAIVLGAGWVLAALFGRLRGPRTGDPVEASGLAPRGD